MGRRSEERGLASRASHGYGTTADEIEFLDRVQTRLPFIPEDETILMSISPSDPTKIGKQTLVPFVPIFFLPCFWPHLLMLSCFICNEYHRTKNEAKVTQLVLTNRAVYLHNDDFAGCCCGCPYSAATRHVPLSKIKDVSISEGSTQSGCCGCGSLDVLTIKAEKGYTSLVLRDPAGARVLKDAIIEAKRNAENYYAAQEASRVPFDPSPTSPLNQPLSMRSEPRPSAPPAPIATETSKATASSTTTAMSSLVSRQRERLQLVDVDNVVDQPPSYEKKRLRVTLEPSNERGKICFSGPTWEATLNTIRYTFALAPDAPLCILLKEGRYEVEENEALANNDEIIAQLIGK